ncbi:hypothetical protein HD806DRAFT_544816 [Xylariaceae sp. AK1471]|nr:hypothetical protein HD806DRAFT_544816 [Xylariaceae sp. AK1471]
METSSGSQPEPEEAQTRSNERDDNDPTQNLRSILDMTGTTDDAGNTVLHLAAREKMVDKLEPALQNTLCKELGNSKNKDGKTPLHISCMAQDRASAKILLDNGADINATDMLGLTPLHSAIIAQGNIEDGTEGTTEEMSLIELILAEGRAKKLNIHIKTFHQGATALHLAAIWALPGVVRLLLQNGADRHSTTWRGETVLHWAFRTMREDEENYPQQMVPNLGGSHVSDSGSHVPDEDVAATGNPKIARYGMDMISALISTDEQERWKELLRIAYREDDEKMVLDSAQRLFPHKRDKGEKLVKLWLAMRPEKFKRLKTELLNGVAERKRADWDSQNVLDLAAHCDLYEVVRWLLKSNNWSKKEKNDAKRRVPNINSNSQWETVWDIPFLQDGGRGDEFYGYLSIDGSHFTDKFQSSIVNFYSSGRYTHFLHHLCNVRDLLYNGKKGPAQIMEEKAKAFKKTFSELNTDTYDNSHLRFRWIHLPVNCMEWMKVATTISFKDKNTNRDNFTAIKKFLLQSWHELPENRGKDKYMHPTCLRKGIPRGKATWPPHPGDRASKQLALYMPYITFAKPTDKTKEKEKKLRSAEEGKTRIIHRSKTLDTYHLGTTNDEKARERDREQVVFRHASKKICDYTRRTNHEKEIDDAEIQVLHVGQLWLETHNSHDDYSPIFENVLNYLNDNNEQLGRDIVPPSLDHFVEFITSFYINTPFNLSIPLTPLLDNDDERESLHDMFLSSIERVNSEEDKLRRKFKQEMHSQDEGEKVDGEKNLHRSVTETIELLSEIKDIQQELNIISSVIVIQRNVWDQLTNRSQEPDKLASASHNNESMNWAGGTEPAQYVLRRISDLLRFAEETQKNVESILDLKMNQLSLLQAEEAGRQGTTLMVFTTVTVLFTPLSFLSALFALNISIFPHSGTDLLYEPGWLFGILFGVTFGVIAIALAYIYRHKFSGKKRGKEPRQESDVTDHRGLRLIHENRVSRVWDMVQQMRKRRSTHQETLPTTAHYPDK